MLAPGYVRAVSPEHGELVVFTPASSCPAGSPARSARARARAGQDTSEGPPQVVINLSGGPRRAVNSSAARRQFHGPNDLPSRRSMLIGWALTLNWQHLTLTWQQRILRGAGHIR